MLIPRRAAIPPSAASPGIGHLTKRDAYDHFIVKEDLKPFNQTEYDHPRQGPGPFIVLAGCWIPGVWLGQAWPSATPWLALGAGLGAIAVAMVCRSRPRAAGHWASLALITTAAAWTTLQQHHAQAHDIARFVGPKPQLAQVTGVVDSPPRLASPRRGAFGAFSYKQPATQFVLRVESMLVNAPIPNQDATAQPASGRLLTQIRQADHRLQYGDRIEATGWLSPLHPPANPGQHDYRPYWASRGVRGRISLRSRGNWRPIAPHSALTPFQRWHTAARQAAAMSLRLGIAPDPARLAFLNTLLLGRRDGSLGPLDTQFRQVGLAHLLSISGAHLGILLGLVWITAGCVIRHPARIAMLVLMVLAFYLLVVTPRVPVIRASIMAGLWCATYATGRYTRALDLMALAAVLVLIWRPSELFAAGFQLSFGVVAALLIFTKPVAHWLATRVTGVAFPTRDKWYLRWPLNYLAANTVAFLVAMPLVAYHFKLISPIAIIASLAVWPVVGLVLALGYFKIALGLVLPSVGLALAGPLQALSETMVGGVQHVSTWPGTSIALLGQPSVAWTIATLLVTTALFAGWFADRRSALLAAAGLCAAGLLNHLPLTANLWRSIDAPPQATVQLNMFAVGDGSCYLLQLNPGSLHHHTLMFDCGSQAYLDVGEKSIVPALKHMGIQRIDTLLISHADLDHFNGGLAVVDHLGVGRVLMSPHMRATAQQQPQSATAFFFQQLQQRNIKTQTVSQGWQETHTHTQLEILWPPATLQTRVVNDTSLVLSVRSANRRILLNGDIQTHAIHALLNASIDLRADVSDLPHHGSYVAASPQWLQAVNPAAVLQSSGPINPTTDRWQPLLNANHMTRWITANTGMVQLTLHPNGSMAWQAFKHKRSQ